LLLDDGGNQADAVEDVTTTYAGPEIYRGSW